MEGIISMKKYLPIINKIVAPIDKLITTNKLPSHFPNIKPPTSAMGLPNPNNITQIIVKKINTKERNIKLLFFKSNRKSLLVCINL